MTTATLEAKPVLAKGIRVATPDELELHAKYHEAAGKIKALKAEQDTAKALLVEAMRQTGSMTLTHDGVVVVEIVVTNTATTDKEGLFKEYPNATKFFGHKPGTKFDAKKPVGA